MQPLLLAELHKKLSRIDREGGQDLKVYLDISGSPDVAPMRLTSIGSYRGFHDEVNLWDGAWMRDAMTVREVKRKISRLIKGTDLLHNRGGEYIPSKNSVVHVCREGETNDDVVVEVVVPSNKVWVLLKVAELS